MNLTIGVCSRSPREGGWGVERGAVREVKSRKDGTEDILGY